MNTALTYDNCCVSAPSRRFSITYDSTYVFKSYNLCGGARSVQKFLQRIKNLANKELKVSNTLTPMHKKNWISWTNAQIQRRSLIWHWNIFSDENSFFWMSQTGPLTIDGRTSRGGTVFAKSVWRWRRYDFSGVYAADRLKIVFMESIMDSLRYVYMLKTTL